ncbi:MAG: DUF2218 domain-containing protein [Anaerolineae bacterium]|nr:DUF2218 domain-containing protein [Anaerolineae bacterium]
MNAHAKVEVTKASRYLKALCNHSNRKVTAEHSDDHGVVQFGFGYCEMEADADALTIHIQAEDSENFDRVKAVVGDHLERFANNEFQVEWVDRN